MSIWYLVCTSVLYVGQHYLERYFGRGSSRSEEARQDLVIGALGAPPEGGGAR